MKNLFFQTKALFNEQWPETELLIGSYGTKEGDYCLFTLQDDPFRQITLELTPVELRISYYTEIPSELFSFPVDKGGENHVVTVEQLPNGKFEIMKIFGTPYQADDMNEIPMFVLDQIKTAISLRPVTNN